LTLTILYYKVCTGAKSIALAEEASKKYAKIIKKLGFPVVFKDFKIQNIVASFDFKKPIKLDEFVTSEIHKYLVFND
jgi:transcription initiation factor TFIID TATA-box-binding protein